jgi:catechol-2,3-dioxygenase
MRRSPEARAMKLNHLNLTVTDVPETHRFLGTYFGLRTMFGNNNLAVLSDDAGFVLTLTSMKIGNQTEVQYPANFHIGFGQESEERVNEINRRLKDDGFNVPPASKQHGAWTFYFLAPGGFTIEVLAPLDDVQSR